MSATKRGLLRVGILLAAVAVVGSQGMAAMQNHAGHAMAQAKATDQKPAMVSLDDIHAKQLPAVQEAIRKAIEQIEAGHTQVALAELRKAQSSLAVAQQALGQHIKRTFVNSRCPILGNPIDLTNVPANLIREYHGQKVAFCCAGCPAAWDKLSDAEKAAKLKAAEGSQPNTDSHAHPKASMNMQK
jgi:hypothetical protein